MSKQNPFTMLCIAAAIAVGSGYAVAEPKPVSTKPAPAQADANSCNCAACKQKEDKGGMGMQGGGMADKGGMGGMMKMGKDECPMMADGGPMTDMTVQAENTKQGAVLRLIAKNPADIQKIQKMAEKMAKHMESGCKMHGQSGDADKDGDHAEHKH